MEWISSTASKVVNWALWLGVAYAGYRALSVSIASYLRNNTTVLPELEQLARPRRDGMNGYVVRTSNSESQAPGAPVARALEGDV